MWFSNDLVSSCVISDSHFLLQIVCMVTISLISTLILLWISEDIIVSNIRITLRESYLLAQSRFGNSILKSIVILLI